MLVGEFVIDYLGRRFRCFANLASAFEWRRPP